MFGTPAGESGFVGPYRITRRLGIGPTSEVLLAVSQGPYGFERPVVVKRLLRKHEVDPALHRRLAAEAVAYARLTHPAIVRMYDFLAPRGRVALVLEYVDGPSLARLRGLLKGRREALGDDAAYYIASRVFAALAAAHAARDPRTGEFAPVIHRDVSPGNVLIPWDGFVKLGDFGVAKVSGISSESRTGSLKGTYGYMAPEQILGAPVTPRTDVYAASLLLRELLVGRPAFDQGALPELEFLRSMAEPKLAPIEDLRAGVPAAVADALRRGLAIDPERRTLTAADMANVLKEAVDLERAHRALVDVLARVRPADARPSTPTNGVEAVVVAPPSTTMRLSRASLLEPLADGSAGPIDTPSGLSMSDLLSEPPPPPRQRPRWPVAAAVVGATVVAAAAAIALAVPPGPTSAPSMAVLPRGDEGMRVAPPAVPAAPPTPAVPAPRPAAAPVTPAASASPVPVPTVGAPPAVPTPAAATTGDIATPASARMHRVYVDGQFAAGESGATLHVRCGPHTVRIGSQGRTQSVVVPCGGVIEAAPR